MTPNDARPKDSYSRRVALGLAGGAVALVLAFGAGRLTSNPPPAPPALPGREAAPPEHAPPAPPPTAWVQPAAPGAAAQAAGGAAAAPVPPSRASASRTYRTPVAPGQLAAYRAEVVTHVEQQRRQVVSTCWPREGLPKGQRSATLTYNVTFSPDGREIGRGLVQDRRAPAGKFAKCLAQLQGMPFSISPPGTYVTLRVPVTYP